MQKSLKADTCSKHGFLFCLSSHIVMIILVIAEAVVCIETGFGVPVTDQDPLVTVHMKPFYSRRAYFAS